jgi:hypothetical protein
MTVRCEASAKGVRVQEGRLFFTNTIVVIHKQQTRKH